MKANPTFSKIPKNLWADIKFITQQVGYTEKTKKKKGQPAPPKTIKIPSPKDILTKYAEAGLQTDHLFNETLKPTKDGQVLLDYFAYRATILNDEVRPNLMNAAQAKAAFETVRKRVDPKELIKLPMNKQKGEKKSYNYLTGLVTLLIKEVIKDEECDFDPRCLTTITHEGKPLRTLSRRVDGAFPGPVNPIAIWEIKEYYFTTTFGSRVADGIYETLLDGLELEELEIFEKKKVQHFLMVDAYKTWWEDGRSYLCRMVDMLHAGYVDEILFGKEVITRLPELADELLEAKKKRDKKSD